MNRKIAKLYLGGRGFAAVSLGVARGLGMTSADSSSRLFSRERLVWMRGVSRRNSFSC